MNPGRSEKQVLLIEAWLAAVSFPGPEFGSSLKSVVTLAIFYHEYLVLYPTQPTLLYGEK